MTALDRIKHLREQEAKKNRADTLWVISTIIWIITLTFFGFFLITMAHASECYSVRDQDSRQSCLARERGNPDECTSIRGWDEREHCRQVARERSKR